MREAAGASPDRAVRHTGRAAVGLRSLTTTEQPAVMNTLVIVLTLVVVTAEPGRIPADVAG